VNDDAHSSHWPYHPSEKIYISHSYGQLSIFSAVNDSSLSRLIFLDV